MIQIYHFISNFISFLEIQPNKPIVKLLFIFGQYPLINSKYIMMEIFIQNRTHILLNQNFIAFFNLILLLFKTLIRFLQIFHKENTQIHSSNRTYSFWRLCPRMTHINRSCRLTIILQILD